MASGNCSQGFKPPKSERDDRRSADDAFVKIWNAPETERLAISVIQSIRSRTLGGRLRTLREIEVFSSRLNEKIAYSSLLRQEALRHIRYQQSKGEDRKAIEWIKDFFNVTDADIIG